MICFHKKASKMPSKKKRTPAIVLVQPPKPESTQVDYTLEPEVQAAFQEAGESKAGTLSLEDAQEVLELFKLTPSLTAQAEPPRDRGSHPEGTATPEQAAWDHIRKQFNLTKKNPSGSNGSLK